MERGPSGRRAGARLSGKAFWWSVVPDWWSVSLKARAARARRAKASAASPAPGKRRVPRGAPRLAAALRAAYSCLIASIGDSRDASSAGYSPNATPTVTVASTATRTVLTEIPAYISALELARMSAVIP